MSIIYNNNVPLSSNNPSNDQPEMLINTQSIAQLIGVDHLGFSPANPSGTHTHVTFATPAGDPGLSDSQTQIYPKTFGTGSTYLETYTAAKPNGAPQINGYLPFVKYIVRFQSAGANSASITPTAGWINANVGTIAQTSGSVAGQIITINFASALPSANYYIFQSQTGIGSNLSTFTGLTVTYSNTQIILDGVNQVISGTRVFAFMVI